MRLIDADKLYNKFDTLPWYDNQDRDEIALQEVVDAPTIDAVVVTRCKNCNHLVNASVNSNGFLICSVSDMVVALDDFCSYGEPMEGVDNPLHT